MRTIFSNLTRCWFALVAGSLCFTSTALFADSKLCNQLVQVNPQQDFLLEYGDTAIQDIYQAVLGLNPNTQIVGQFNSFLSPTLVVNPAKSKNIAIAYSQDSFRERVSPRIFARTGNGGAQIAYSNDGGKTWHHSNAALPTLFDENNITADGLSNIAQEVNTQGGLSFSKKGVLYAFGSFNQTHTLDSLDSHGGVYVSKSTDGGALWHKPVVLDVVKGGAFSSGQGIIVNAAGILADPLQEDKVHALWDLIDNTQGTLYGNVWYSHSRDEGRRWLAPRLIYDMVLDPTWVAQHGFTNYNVTPAIQLGGQAITSGTPLVAVPLKGKKDKSISSSEKARSQGEVLLAGILRFYPAPGATVYDQTVNTTISDHVVVRSFDGGATWTESGVVVGGGPYIFSESSSPIQPTGFSIISFDASLASYLAVSPKTNRVYYVWQGGNTSLSSDPAVATNLPTIQFSSSNDAGASWTPAVNINTLPNNPILAANQDFNPNIAIRKDGTVGIIFSTFRNFTGGQTVVESNNMLAIYKETSDPKGGSTGIGLDFCELIQLGPTFNGQIAYDFPHSAAFPPPAGIGFSLINGFGASNAIAAQGKDFLTAFDTTNQGNLPLVTSPVFGFLQDINNRVNVQFDRVCKVKCKKK